MNDKNSLGEAIMADELAGAQTALALNAQSVQQLGEYLDSIYKQAGHRIAFSGSKAAEDRQQTLQVALSLALAGIQQIQTLCTEMQGWLPPTSNTSSRIN